MFTPVIILVGLALAAAILSLIPKLKNNGAKTGVAVLAMLVLFVFVTISSVRYVPDGQVGIVVKNVGAQSLPEGRVIAVSGEKGAQAEVLMPGWHPWLWPVIYNVELENWITIADDEIGLLTAADGRPMPAGDVYAPEWTDAQAKQMLSAQFFLTDGAGVKGPQTYVLRPGRYALNTRLFQIEKAPVINIPPAMVGVVKSNVGPRTGDGASAIVPVGSRGVWETPLFPQKYYLHTKAHEVTMISTEERTVRFTAEESNGELSEIEVISNDGYKFPVDVRVEYRIQPSDAANVVTSFQDDGARLAQRLNSVVRAVFRNNAEGVNALAYVKQRSKQESQSLVMIAEAMSDFGITVTGVRIGNVGNQETLGDLLKTQTDREIALQEQETFQEQQRAAEQRKALTRTLQEAEEEKRLATAQYQVKIAEQEKQQMIIAAEAGAEAIAIEARAQAEAFRAIAEQIGQGNAALIELLKIVGDRGIGITPRVMVVGDGAGSQGAETTALIGTMLDSMISQPDTAQGPRLSGAADQ